MTQKEKMEMGDNLSPDQFDILTALATGQDLYTRGERWFLGRSTHRRKPVRRAAVLQLLTRGLLLKSQSGYEITEEGFRLLTKAQEVMNVDLVSGVAGIKPEEEDREAN
ncbi:MAG: hypothetical protein JSU61_13755 [Fidelibacterota bacterium]|nr:MAG: hypothetical protein JSU61_13755 [Candidatus Neomarinimicrobiota bacterium]